MAVASRRGRSTGLSVWLAVLLIGTPVGLWGFTLLRTETWIGRVIVVAVGLIATLVAALMAWPFIRALFAKQGPASTAAVVNVSQALLAGLLAGWTAFAVIPEGATVRIEETLVQLAEGQQEIIYRLEPETSQTAPIRTRLPGRWGEVGCDVVWHFALEGNALTAEVVETLPDLPPYRLLASVTAAEGYRLDTTGEEPAAARGMAATFTLDDTGAVPRLSWADRTRDVPLVLEPCPEPTP